MILGAITGVPTPACLSATSNPVETMTPPRGGAASSVASAALSKNCIEYKRPDPLVPQHTCRSGAEQVMISIAA